MNVNRVFSLFVIALLVLELHAPFVFAVDTAATASGAAAAPSLTIFKYRDNRDRYDDIFVSCGNEFGVDPNFLKVIGNHESGIRNVGPNSAGAIGIMQIVAPPKRAAGAQVNQLRQGTSRPQVNAQNLLDPQINICAGAEFWHYLSRRGLESAVMAYTGYNVPSNPYMNAIRSEYQQATGNVLSNAVFTGVLTPTVNGVVNQPQPLNPLLAGSGQVCSINELNADQARAILEATRDFKAKEVNALTSKEDIFGNDPKANLKKEQSQTVNVFVAPQAGNSLQLAQVLIQLDVEYDKKNREIIHSLLKRDITGNEFITYEEAVKIANRFGKSENPLKNLLNAVQGKASEGATGPDYANYKVKIPGGIEVPYGQLAALGEIKPDACLLDSAHLQGRAYYVGRLYNDAVISLPNAVSAKANNTFASKQATVNFALNGADDLVVPQRYVDYVSKIKTWMAIDFFLTAFETMNLKLASKDLEKGQTQLKELQQIRSNFDPIPHYFTSITSTPEKKALLDLIGPGSQKSLNPAEASKSIQTALSSGHISTEARGALTPLKAEFDRIATSGISTAEKEAAASKLIASKESSLYSSLGFNNQEISEVSKYKNKIVYDDQIAATSQKLSLNKGLTRTELETFKGKLSKFNGELGYRLAAGYAWMGPARIALQLVDGLVLYTIDGRKYQDAYILIHINKQGVLKDFRDATNWMGSGTAMDMVADLTDQGVPKAAFNPGKVIVINAPFKDKAVKVSPQDAMYSEESSTSFTGVENTGWNVGTSWKGDSNAIFFEDLENSQKYARLSIQAKNTVVSGGSGNNNPFMRSSELSAYFSTLKFVFPLIGWQLIDRSGTPLTAIFRVYAFDQMFGDYNTIFADMMRPDHIKDGEKCDDKVVQEHVDYYKYWTAAQHAANLAYVYQPWLKSLSVIKKSVQAVPVLGSASKYLEFISTNIAPGTLAQGYAASQGMQYVSNCKDDTVNVVTWQNLQSKADVNTLSSRLTSVSSNDFTSQLNLGQAFGGVGSKVSQNELREFVNLKATLKDQQTQANVDALYYVHLQDVKKEFWNNDKACMTQCFDDQKKVICMTKDGVKVCDKDKKSCVEFEDKLRGPLGWENDALGYAFLPNKIITASIANCNVDKVFVIPYSAALKSSSQCDGTECIRSQLSVLAGRQIGTDLSAFLGKVTTIYTEKGRIAFSRTGEIMFTPFTGGAQVKSPSSEVIDTSQSSTQDESYKQAGFVEIASDGQTVLTGYLTNSTQVSEENLGKFKTIFTERGRIDYNDFTGTVDVLVQSLASVNAADIRDFETSADKCSDGSYKVKIDRFIGKSVIGDQASQELNGALKNWMKDCADGASYFEDSAGNKYELTKDGKLVVTDKDGKVIGEYKVNGVSKDGKDVVFDTNKGEVRLNMGMNENGQPIINVNYPDRDSTGGLLKLLGGVGGALVYNPATGQWELANGLPFGLSPDFTKFGQTIKQDSDGNIRGLPTQNIFSLPPETSKRGTANPLAALPSWPEDNAATILLVIGLLGVAVAIRTRKN